MSFLGDFYSFKDEHPDVAYDLIHSVDFDRESLTFIIRLDGGRAELSGLARECALCNLRRFVVVTVPG
ncbi:hypothetical protein [Microbulbifer thermotolerans]|uniref:hypothetical protein n=1 Tax=Microbulbifer thermotolerans TaxID=252514 RepID=UPI001113F809|nr:hypothetical protein [Microbulbifer thermotolerans]